MHEVVAYILNTGKISLYCRGKYSIKIYAGTTSIKYINIENKLLLQTNSQEYIWNPESENNFLNYFPLEIILEIDIIECYYS